MNMEIIRDIRDSLGLTQTQLAREIGVSFATVNRWEKDHFEPNRLAQAKILDICNKSGVDLVAMLEHRIQAESEAIVGRNPSRKVLYHGSKSGIKGNIIPSSRNRCDFGSGFYMGTDAMQPLTLICDFDKSVFYIVSIDLEGLRIIDIPKSIEWAMFIAYHRGRLDSIKGSVLYGKWQDIEKDYDIVVGNIADDRMFFVLDSFFQGNITDKALVESLSTLALGKQYAAITQKACNKIRLEMEINLSWLEREALKQAGEKNRKAAIILADRICKDYRREGLYFDEILSKGAI